MGSVLHRRAGFSLIEMLIYVAIVSATGVFMVGLVISFARTFALASVTDDINESAMASLERVTKEVQAAGGINEAASTFSESGELVLETENVDGTPVSRRFYLDAGRLMLQDDAGTPLALTRDRIDVTTFYLEHLTSPHSEGVRITLVLEGSRGTITQQESFRTAALTRSY
jgi:hypothetical protein